MSSEHIRPLSPLGREKLQPSPTPQSKTTPSWSGRKVSHGPTGKHALFEQWTPRLQKETEDLSGLSPRRLVDRCRQQGGSDVQLREIALDLERRYKVDPLLRTFSSIDLSLLIHSFTKRKVIIPSLFSKIAKTAIERGLKDWKAQDLSLFAWSFASARERNGPLFEAIAREVCRRATAQKLNEENCSPQNLSNLVWAFVTADELDTALLHAIADEVTRRLSDPHLAEAFDMQHLSNLLWSFAKSGLQHPELLQAIESELLRRARSGALSTCSPQHLSLIPWSFAVLDHRIPELMKLIGQEIQKRKQSREGLRAFQPRNFSHLAWALGKMAVRDDSLLQTIAMEVISRSRQGRLREFDGQHFSNLLLGFAKLEVRHDALFDVIEAELVARPHLSSLSEQDLSTISWAFARVNLGSASVFQLLIGHALSRGLHRFNDQALMMMLWSVTKSPLLSGEMSDRFFLSVRTELEKRPVSSSDRVLFLWCAAVQKRMESDWFQSMLSGLDCSHLKTLEIHQLLQIRLETQIGQQNAIRWPKPIEELLDQFLTHEQATQPSQLHREVENTLNHVLERDGLPKAEVEARVAIYHVDLLIRVKKLILQVHGPTHRRDDAIEAFRHRQLETLGYRVHIVWWHRWNRLTESERLELVRALL